MLLGPRFACASCWLTALFVGRVAASGAGCVWQTSLLARRRRPRRLALFFIGLMLAAVVVEAFEEMLRSHVELSYFVPLLIGRRSGAWWGSWGVGAVVVVVEVGGVASLQRCVWLHPCLDGGRVPPHARHATRAVPPRVQATAATRAARVTRR